jgi:hypothetical protein
MKTLTEKVNGRREWSAYGLYEIQRIKTDDLMLIIIISNALLECGLKATEQNSRMFLLSKDLFVRATRKGIIIGKDSYGSEIIFETVKDPRTLFERIRVVWGNCYP